MSPDERADEIVGRCRERLERGERIDADAVVREHPQFAAALRERLAVLLMIHDASLGQRTAGATDAASLVGATLGAFRLVSELGSGGMGTVFLAERGGERRAVKVLHPHLLAKPGSFKRFLREAEIGKRVRHENVVATLDADAIDVGGRAVHFLVMEYVEGQTLRSLLDELGRVPEELCRHIGRESAKALAAVHAAGAVHRDVKPDNVLITKDHVVKLMDLGVSRAADDELRVSQTGAFDGSVRYAAPEQIRAGGSSIDARADLYALGLTLYELATGVHPFAGDDFAAVLHQQLTQTPRPAGEVNPQLSAFFEDLLRRLLEKDAEKRVASASELASILDEGEKSAWWRDRATAIRAQTQRPLRRIRIPRETALYGRDAELAKLRALYDEAKFGDGRVVVVEGEAGIGKTRLVDEFVGLLRRDGEDVNFLFGGNPPGGAATASGAFTTAYREQFGDEGLEATLARYLTVTPILVPAFAALLRGEPPPEGQEPLTKDSLQTVFVHATRALAAERPTIVLVDDLHFAPEEGRALFASLAMAVPGHRVLLVGTTRPELDEKWLANLTRLEQTRRMPLARLGPKDLARLLVDAFRSERLAEELSFKIAAKSDGNPYFVFEILRGLRDGQFIKRQPDGTWVTTRIIAEIEVPSTVKDLIFARVSNLPTEERNLLDVAAVAGFEFDPALVGKVVGLARIPAFQRLAAIEKSHRLVRSAGRRFVFDHHQVAETLYTALPEPLREEYHAGIAAGIERAHGADAREPKDLDGAVCVEIAEHFLKGAQGARALRYLDAALTHLEKGYLNDAAVRLADSALAVPELVVGRGRVELLLREVARLHLLGRRDAERAALDQATPLADMDGDVALRACVLRSFGWHLASIWRIDEAIAMLSESLDLARAASDGRAEAAATNDLGAAFWSVSRISEARAQFERALALALKLGDRRGEAATTGNLGNVFASSGRFIESKEHHERQLAFAQETGDRLMAAAATGSLGIACAALGRFAEAQEHYERRIAFAHELGDRRGEAHAITNLGVVALSVGRLADAREMFARSLVLARELADSICEAANTGNLGEVSFFVGRLAYAREQSERQLALARELGARQCEGDALKLCADLASNEGDDAGAEHRLAEALELRRAIGQRDGEAAILLGQGARLARLGRIDEARAAIGKALAIARELSLASVEVLATAELAGFSRSDLVSALESLSLHESRVELRTTMEARFLLWHATHDPAHLAEAKRLLDHLVEHAPPDCRESMLANVRLHREIAAAAREARLDGGDQT